MGTTSLSFLFLFLGLLGLSLIKHPRYGIYAYLIAFYVHPPSRWWGSELPNIRWSMLAAVITLLAIWRFSHLEVKKTTLWYKTSAAKLLIVWTLWLWLQWLWAMDQSNQLILAQMYTKYLFLYYLLYKICTNTKEIDYFMFAHLAGCAFLGYLAVNQDISGRLEGVGGPGIDEANAMAMQLATSVMYGAMVVLTKRDWCLYLTIPGLALILNAIVLANSRSATIAMLVGGICLFFLKPLEYRKLFYILTIMAAMSFIGIANKNFWDRMHTINAVVDENIDMDTSAESRLALARAQFNMALKHPFGTGHRGTEMLSREYLPEIFLSRNADGTRGSRSSHSTFLSVWVEQGFIGVIIFILIVLWCRKACVDIGCCLSRPGRVIERSLLASICAGLVVVLTAGFFVDYLKAEVAIWLMVMLASLQQAVKLDDEKNCSLVTKKNYDKKVRGSFLKNKA